MAVNWGLGQGNNALAMFQYGTQLGQAKQQQRDAREDRNALIELRQKQEERLAAQGQREEQQHQQEQRRADLPLMERLLTYSQDEGTYQQARQVAQQYGVDVSGLPQNFDPAWRDQQLQTVKLLATPHGQEALSTAGKQAQDAGFQPGTPEYTAAVRQIITASMAQPYTGSQGETRLYSPDVFGGGGQAQGGPQPGAIEDGYRFKGGNPADPNAWEPVNGGPTQPASGGFRP